MKNIQASRLRNLATIWEAYLSSCQKDQLDRWLRIYFRENKKYGSKDRRFYRDSLFSLLRVHGICSYIINKNEAIEEYSAIKTSDDLVKMLRAIDLSKVIEILDTLDNKKLKQMISSMDLSDPIHIAVLCSSDIFFSERLLERRETNFAQLETYILNLTYQPYAWIRIDNPRKSNEIESEAKSNGVIIGQKNGTYYFQQSSKIKSFKSYARGYFDFQDLASQSLIKGLPNVFNPHHIWDACCGAGGKSLSLSNIFPNSHIYCSDIRAHKTEVLGQTINRQQRKNMTVFTHDLLKPLPISLQRKFDLIVLDAPCSSSGVLRRSPDVKLRIKHNTLYDFQDIQARMLDKAMQSLETGGYLIYSTCSIFTEENEFIVERFLKKNPNVHLYASDLIGSPHENSDTMYRAIIHKA